MRIVLCLVAIVMVCLSGSVVIAAPNLQFDNPKYDFGEVFQGGKVSMFLSLLTKAMKLCILTGSAVPVVVLLF